MIKLRAAGCEAPTRRNEIVVDNSKSKELFDHWAADYNPAVQADDGFPFDSYEDVLNEVVGAASAKNGAHIVDMGTGTGNLARRFLQLGCNVWGVDFSAEMLLRARANLPNARFIQADLSLSWPNALPHRFDCIASAYVLHEFDLRRKVALISEWADHLVKGGSVVVGDISFETVTVREATHGRWLSQWDDDERYWAADETIHACEQASLAVVYKQISSCGGAFIFKSQP